MSGRVGGLFLTQPIAELGHLDGVMFSGGVAEYVYGRETRDFGDMGGRLGGCVAHAASRGTRSLPRCCQLVSASGRRSSVRRSTACS